MKHTTITALLMGALLAGCGGGGGLLNGSATNPSTTQANLGSNKLQLAVGTAYNANDTTLGLNVVETFRQPNGNSAVLASNPSLTGPFTVTPALGGAYCIGTANNVQTPNVDIGTGGITSSPQVNLGVTPVNTTLGAFSGAFSYGFAPLNSDQITQQAYYPGNPNSSGGSGFTSSAYDNSGATKSAAAAYCSGAGQGLPWWLLPIGAQPADQGIFLIGPPAVAFFNNGTYPVHFAGYSPGFTAFEGVTPKAGTYTLTVNVPTGNAGSPKFTATASLASTAALTAPKISGIAETAGGLTGTVTAGGTATETLVFVWDQDYNSANGGSSSMFYTVELAGGGTQSFTIPTNLGPCVGNGCQNGTLPAPSACGTAGDAGPSLCTGDSYVVEAVSFDYPAFEAGPPGNRSQTPTITGATGQADLSIGAYVAGTY